MSLNTPFSDFMAGMAAKAAQPQTEMEAHIADFGEGHELFHTVQDVVGETDVVWLEDISDENPHLWVQRFIFPTEVLGDEPEATMAYLRAQVAATCESVEHGPFFRSL